MHKNRPIESTPFMSYSIFSQILHTHAPLLHGKNLRDDFSFTPQSAVALLPNITADPLPTSLFEVTNDEHLSIYIGALGRCVVALHDLSANKKSHKELENLERTKEKEGKVAEKAAAEKKK